MTSVGAVARRICGPDENPTVPCAAVYASGAHSVRHTSAISTRSTRAWVTAVARVIGSPSLWPVALRTWMRMSPTRWWRHRPFVPIPDRGYVRFRLDTAYGPDAAPGPDDLAAYLRWCRERDRVRRGAKHAWVHSVPVTAGRSRQAFPRKDQSRED